MDHQVPVQVAHRLAHLEKQSNLRAHAEPRRVPVERFAFDELHRQIRLPALRPARIQQARDARVIQLREDLPLPQKAFQQGALGQVPAQKLHRRPLPHLPIGPFGQIDRAHAAAPDGAHQAEGPARGTRRGLDAAGKAGGGSGDKTRQRAALFAVKGQQGLELGLLRGAHAALRVDLKALLRAEVRHERKQFLRLPGHGSAVLQS